MNSIGPDLMGLVGSALWHSRASQTAAQLSVVNRENASRVLQGLAILALGYLLALAGQLWKMIG
jgi:hypothetical protein